MDAILPNLALAPRPPAGPVRREPGRSVLGNAQRKRIFELIRADPGIHVHAIAAQLGLSWGTTVYHLQVLRRKGVVVAERQGRHLHHFVNGDPTTQHWLAHALLRNPTARGLADAVLASPGLPQKALCAQLGITPSLASWHLRRLAAAGAIEARRAGRSVRYAPGPALGALAGRAPSAAPSGQGAELALVPVA